MISSYHHQGVVRLLRSFRSNPRCLPVALTWPNNLNGIRLASTVFPSPPTLNALLDAEDHNLARSWVQEFEGTRLQRSDVELSFARSSGPGGQNVNKVNTKAIVRLGPLSHTGWIPKWALQALRGSPAYVKYNDSILISSTKHRSQAENVQDCLAKLHNLVKESASAPIKTPLSQETLAKLAASEKAFKARVRRDKERRSQMKASRGNTGHWD